MVLSFTENASHMPLMSFGAVWQSLEQFGANPGFRSPCELGAVCQRVCLALITALYLHCITVVNACSNQSPLALRATARSEAASGAAKQPRHEVRVSTWLGELRAKTPCPNMEITAKSC